MALPATAKLSVWNLGWRSSQQASPPDASFAAGMPVTIEATQAVTRDPAFDRMLAINNSWTTRSSPANDQGFDAADPTTAQARGPAPCLAAATINGNTVTFIGRYYDNYTGQPWNVPPWHTLEPVESASLNAIGLQRVVVWESRRGNADGNVCGPHSSLTCLAPNGIEYFQHHWGYQDGRDAFARAVSVMGQPAQTPIYFAVDFDFDRNQGADRDDLRTYFSDIERAHTDYLADRRANHLDATPYSIGVYGPSDALDLCYRQGICTYFWQANGTALSQHRNTPTWIHVNISQTAIHTKGHQIRVCTSISADYDSGWGDIGGW